MRQLREEEKRAARELQGLQESDAYKQHLNLVDRQRAVEAKAAGARSAEQAAADLETAALQAAGEESRTQEEATAAEAEVNEARAVLVRLAHEAGIDEAVVPRGAAGVAAAAAVAEGRRRWPSRSAAWR